MYLNKLKEKLSQHNVYLKPASNDDVQLFEQRMRFKLPLAYKEFLLLMGKGADYFLKGSDCFINDDFEEMRTQATYILKNSGHSEKFLNNAFVFWMHQGYQMAFFYLSESENPKIHYFSESEKETNGIFSHLDNEQKMFRSSVYETFF